jgi:hypothetical protein
VIISRAIWGWPGASVLLDATCSSSSGDAAGPQRVRPYAAASPTPYAPSSVTRSGLTQMCGASRPTCGFNGLVFLIARLAARCLEQTRRAAFSSCSTNSSPCRAFVPPNCAVAFVAAVTSVLTNTCLPADKGGADGWTKKARGFA